MTAVRGAAAVTGLRVDSMTFRSQAEVSVYRALVAAQAAMPKFRSMTVTPNAPVRVPGRTIEVDFLVLYRGRCGVIEVDGHHHGGRRAHDRSRDRLLENAGLAYVDRIGVEETDDTVELALFVERFLDRLAG